jgi:polysaccharide export outer membrane protein
MDEPQHYSEPVTPMTKTNQKLVACGFVAVLIASATPRSRPQSGPTNEPAAAPRELGGKQAPYSLIISAGDLLDLQVFDSPDLSGKLRVNQHGEINMSLGGSIKVEGLTAEQAAGAVELHLRAANILKNPHASISVLEYATQGVTVVGEVKNPGVYPLLGSHSALDLIAAAGGSTPDAGSLVTINHRDDPNHSTVVDLTDRGSEHTSATDLGVRPGDTVVVAHAGIVYVIGAVTRPGGFLIQHTNRLTVLQAIALAQGTNRTAALDRAKLIRTTPDGRQEIQVPLKRILANKASDQALANNDILFVPSSAAKDALQSLESILPSVASASVYRVP